MERKLIRPREIARTLGISKSAAYRLLEDGRLLRLKFPGRCVGTTPQALQEFLDKAESRGLEE